MLKHVKEYLYPYRVIKEIFFFSGDASIDWPGIGFSSILDPER